MQSLACLALALLLLASAGSATRYFPNSEIWYQNISSRALDLNSDLIIQDLAALGWGTLAKKLKIDFSMIVNLASQTPVNNAPVVASPQAGYFDDCDWPIPTTFPIPNGALIEGETGLQCDVINDDCHLLTVDWANRKIYESYLTNYNTGTGELESGCIVTWDMCRDYPDGSSNSAALRGEWCTSADAAGYPITPLLVTPDEVYNNAVDHAIRFILPNDRIRLSTWMRPATHSAGGTGGGYLPPYGTHLRLKSSFDDSLFTPAAKAITAALRTYGMFLSDGGNLAFTFAGDSPSFTHTWAQTGADPDMLANIPVSAFEVVLSPDGGMILTKTSAVSCVKNVFSPVTCAPSTGTMSGSPSGSGSSSGAGAGTATGAASARFQYALGMFLAVAVCLLLV